MRIAIRPPRRFSRETAIAVIVLAVSCCAGCKTPSAPPVEVWVSEDRFGAPPPSGPIEQRWDVPPTSVVELFGAINETLEFQVAIGAEGSVDVRPQPFRDDSGRVLATDVELFRVHFVEAPPWPGWHIRHVSPSRRAARIGDVLVPADAPLGGLPVQVSASEVLDLWVDVGIPKGAAPGLYTSQLNILVDDQPAGAVEVALQVWPFVLPSGALPELTVDVDQRAVFEHHVAAQGNPLRPARILSDDPNQESLTDALAATMRLLHEHRLTPHLPWLYPVVKVDGDNRLTADWSDYARVASGYIDGTAYADRVAPRCWPVPFDDTFPPPPSYGAEISPLYSRLLGEYFASAAAFMGDKPVAAFVRIASRPDVAAGVRHFGYIVQRAAPELKILVEAFPQDLSGFGWYGCDSQDLREYVDIWAPRGQFFDGASIARDFGAKAWMRADRPPFSGTAQLGAPTVDTRALSWQGKRAHVDAVHLGPATHWPRRSEADVIPQECIEYDSNILCYPGAVFGLTGPVPSVRLKRLRRAAQDAAYFKLLEARGKEHIVQTLLRAMVRYFGTNAYDAHLAAGRDGGWVQEPAWWELARRVMLDQLGTTTGEEYPDERASVPATLRWRRLMEAVRGVDVRVSGMRLRLIGVPPAVEMELDCAISVTNLRRTPVTGEVRFEALPPGWRGIPEARQWRRAAPGEFGTIGLAARGSTLTWGPDGVLYVPLVFAEEGRSPVALAARLCHVSAARLPSPVRLDGDLHEWPMGGGNYAGDFILVTGEGRGGRAMPTGRPTRETLCLVGIWEDRLYFGLRCTGTPASPDSVRSSEIAPDDLVMRGDETVEILLDPTNSGTRLPADLYRIVVRGGGVMFERGVATDPPTGPVRNWAANIRHAVRVYDGHWTAEVEVPLSAFPEEYRAATVWGVNFVRFDATAQESSNWSGAVGNVYDPRSLGNMTIP